MQTTLTLSDLLKLSILQHDEMDDLRSPYKLTEYRRRMRQRVWQQLWNEGEKRTG